MTERQIANLEKCLDRDLAAIADEMWEADERARFDAEVNAVAGRFEPPC